MEKREKLSIYIKNNSRSYLLCRIINMGNTITPDLKFTDVSSYGFITNHKGDNGIANKKLHYSSDHIELSYHRDGSPLYKYSTPFGTKPWRSNYLQKGYRQRPISNCDELLPIVIFEIRNPLIYHSSHIENSSSKKRIHICENDNLFADTQSLFAVIFAKNKRIPLTRISTPDFYSNILAKLTDEIDLCIYICKHQFPTPKPYFDIGFKGWITPYPCNSVSFCHQENFSDELKLKLRKNVFNNTFANYFAYLSDGECFQLTEDKLLIFDAIDYFYTEIENPIVHKPIISKFILEAFKESPSDFLQMSSSEQQKFLRNIYDMLVCSHMYFK